MHRTGIRHSSELGQEYALRTLTERPECPTLLPFERGAASPSVKVSQRGSRRNGAVLRDHDPRWETSQGGSRGGFGSVYGESVQSVGATVASVLWLKLCMVSDALVRSAGDAEKAVCFGVIAASCDAGNEQPHAVRTKSAECSW